MTKQDYERAMADMADGRGEMSAMQAAAFVLRRGLSASNSLPSGLRAPLMAVEEGTEIQGTAPDIIKMAEDCLR